MRAVEAKLFEIKKVFQHVKHLFKDCYQDETSARELPHQMRSKEP